MQLSDAWVDNSDHGRFIRQLKRDRADMILQSQDLLQHLRFDWDRLMMYTKLLKPVFDERNIDFPEFVIQNTSASCKVTKKAPPAPKKRYPVFDFGPLPARQTTCWSLWCPVQSSFTRHGLFLPNEIFTLLTSFVPEPCQEDEKEPYDAEKSDEWSLPRVRIV